MPTTRPTLVRAALALLAAAGLAATAACQTPSGPGASPTPSEGASPSASPSPVDPSPPAAGEPVPLPDDDPLLADVMDDVPTASWGEPGVTLTVIIGGSGSVACVPQPIGASVEGPTEVVVDFTPPEPDTMCTADFRVYGWDVPIAGEVDADQPVTVELQGLSGDGEPTIVTVAP